MKYQQSFTNIVSSTYSCMTSWSLVEYEMDTPQTKPIDTPRYKITGVRVLNSMFLEVVPAVDTSMTTIKLLLLEDTTTMDT